MPEELISEEIIGILQKAGQDVADRSLDTTEYADILWFANQIRLNSEQPVVTPPKPRKPLPDPEDEEQGDRPQPLVTENTPEPESPQQEPEPVESVSVSVENDKREKKKTGGGIKAPFQVPAATAIPNRREVARSLYPLHHKVPSRIQRTIDIAATIKRSAEEEFCVPVQKPASQRWLDVAVVIEKSPGYGIWQQTIKEFIGILQRQGAFRDVKCWFVTSKPDTHELILQSQSGSIRNPKELVLMGDRRLVLVLSDCVTPGWLRASKSGKQKDKELTPCWQDWLSFWGKSHPVTILQMLPAPFWRRTALGQMELLWLRSFEKGALNEKWELETRKPWKDIKLESGFPIPVVTLNPYSLNVWAKGTAGYSPTKTAGIYLKAIQKQLSPQSSSTVISPEPDGEALFKQFMNTASLPARKLAALMSAVPVQLPIVRLIQRSMMRMDSTAVHVAEVFFSGILKRVNEEADPEKRLYDFEPGVRELLTQVISASELAQVIDRISADIARRAGYSSVREFRAQLFMASKGAETEGLEATPEMLEFARVALETLQRLGGEYAEFVERIEREVERIPGGSGKSQETELFWGKKLETYPFKTGQYVEEWADQEYEFEIAEFVADKPQIPWEELDFETAKIVIEEKKQTDYLERLRSSKNREIQLEMVAIPGGSFFMGSPDDDPDAEDNEKPQHQVNVPDFYLGRYPITQAQYLAVMDKNPSSFKGENCPVECVSWDDAQAFCQKLRDLTGKPYRLPTEAEWEYACRAGTTTKYYFGDDASELDKYAWYYGNSKSQTHPVGGKEPNQFQLYDMHGNVWEWCEDDWIDNYAETPEAGNIPRKNDSTSLRVIRGGSWFNYPWICRSAFRSGSYRDSGFSYYGFRVAVSPQ